MWTEGWKVWPTPSGPGGSSLYSWSRGSVEAEGGGAGRRAGRRQGGSGAGAGTRGAAGAAAD